MKTKIVPPKNVSCPSKPQNLATGLIWPDVPVRESLLK